MGGGGGGGDGILKSTPIPSPMSLIFPEFDPSFIPALRRILAMLVTLH